MVSLVGSRVNSFHTCVENEGINKQEANAKANLLSDIATKLEQVKQSLEILLVVAQHVSTIELTSRRLNCNDWCVTSAPDALVWSRMAVWQWSHRQSASSSRSLVHAG